MHFDRFVNQPLISRGRLSCSKSICTISFTLGVSPCAKHSEYLGWGSRCAGLPRCENLWSFSLFCSYLELGPSMLTFCFVLFYLSGECHRFLHQGGARCARCAPLIRLFCRLACKDIYAGSMSSYNFRIATSHLNETWLLKSIKFRTFESAEINCCVVLR